jgi:hypothetical protein
MTQRKLKYLRVAVALIIFLLCRPSFAQINTTTANASATIVAGFWNGGNGAVDGFEVLFSTGNIASGIIKIYGVT